MGNARQIEDLDQIPGNARLCLYGAGGFCQNVLKRLAVSRPDVTVTLLTDTFKTGKAFGLELVAPGSLAGENRGAYDFVFVTAGSVARNAILSTLLSMGIDNVLMANDDLQHQCFFQNCSEGHFVFNTINVELTAKCNMACEFCGFRARRKER